MHPARIDSSGRSQQSSTRQSFIRRRGRNRKSTGDVSSHIPSVKLKCLAGSVLGLILQRTKSRGRRQHSCIRQPLIRRQDRIKNFRGNVSSQALTAALSRAKEES
jgi:hypothetical protein